MIKYDGDVSELPMKTQKQWSTHSQVGVGAGRGASVSQTPGKDFSVEKQLRTTIIDEWCVRDACCEDK